MQPKYLIITACTLALAFAPKALALETNSSASSRSSREISEITVNSKTDVKVQAQDNERVLPTVNKATDESQENSQRVLPTVNKRSAAKVTVRGWDAEKKTAIEDRIQAALDANPEIASADVSEDSIAMDYKAPAKLFGFIPMNMQIGVSSDIQGRVKVKFPWYRFMVSTEFSNIAQETNEVFQQNQTDLEFLRKQDKTEAQVQTFIQISSILKARHEMAMSIIQNMK